MKIDPATFETLEEKGFIVRENQIAGNPAFLIIPQDMGVEWTKENVIFRSSIWCKKTGELISAGFKKFVNWGEKPDTFPVPDSIDNCPIMEKLDGSLLTVTRYKDELIHRTRGTFNAEDLDNGFEIKMLKEKYPNAFDNKWLHDFSLIFEWTTPNNKIILDYGDEPDISLIGIIRHEDYSLLRQDLVDEIAGYIGVKRPKYYSFSSITEMIEVIQGIKDKEGVCIYHDNGQEIKKVKGLEYLKKHAFKSHLSPKSMVELFFEYDRPSEPKFIYKIRTEFDWECEKMARPMIEAVRNTYDEFMARTEVINKFVLPLREKERKEAAEIILNEYKVTGETGIAFRLLDGKEIDDQTIRKALLEKLKD